jgi:hypothetical protein
MATRNVNSGLVASHSAPQIGIGFATQLWLNWAWIALDHRDDARVARKADGEPANNPELQASMVAIVAASCAIDGFATATRELGRDPDLEAASKPSRATVIWETLRANFDVNAKTQTWPPALKVLWRLRSTNPGGGLVHPKTDYGEPAPLSGGIPPSPARSTYTVESAIWAVDLMRDTVSSCNVATLRQPAPAALRDRVQGYVAYVAQYDARA